MRTKFSRPRRLTGRRNVALTQSQVGMLSLFKLTPRLHFRLHSVPADKSFRRASRPLSSMTGAQTGLDESSPYTALPWFFSPSHEDGTGVPSYNRPLGLFSQIEIVAQGVGTMVHRNRKGGVSLDLDGSQGQRNVALTQRCILVRLTASRIFPRTLAQALRLE